MQLKISRRSQLWSFFYYRLSGLIKCTQEIVNYGFSYMEPPLINENIRNNITYISVYKILYRLQENMLQGLYDLLTISEDDSYTEKTTQPIVPNLSQKAKLWDDRCYKHPSALFKDLSINAYCPILTIHHTLIK